MGYEIISKKLANVTFDMKRYIEYIEFIVPSQKYLQDLPDLHVVHDLQVVQVFLARLNFRAFLWRAGTHH